MPKIYVKIKTAGERKGLETTEYTLPDNITTLHSLITETVKHEAARYNTEKSANINPETACANALQCFEDGLIRIVLNETELTQLTEQITLNSEDTLTFIRLTFLAGRLW